MRSAASCTQPLHESSVPRGARMFGRFVDISATLGTRACDVHRARKNSTSTLQILPRAADKPDVREFRASRRRGGAVHRGMVWLLRHQARWLVDMLIELRVLPPGPHAIELLPNETWPVGEENRSREIRADVVLRLWPCPVPEESSLKMIRASNVIGLILDFQERRERDKELRVLEYDSAYPPVLGPQIHMVVLTLHEPVARWMRQVFSRKQLSMQTCV